MAERDSQRVRGVVWAWCLPKPKQRLHHPLHLGFLGLSVANHCLFDLGWGIRCNGTPGVCRRKFHDTCHLTDYERAAHISAEEYLLKRDDINSEFCNETRDFIVNLFQARFGCSLRVRPDVPIIMRGGTVRLRCHYAVSSIRDARVDAKNNHQRFCVAARLLGGGLQKDIGDVKVSVNLLHVFQFIESHHQSEHPFRFFALEFDGILRNHADFSELDVRRCRLNCG